MKTSLAIFAVAFAVAGCQTPKAVKDGSRAVKDYRDGAYGRAIDRLEPLSHKTDENYVLNNLRLGSAALAAYDLDDAEQAFLRAWEIINAGGVNSGGRSVGATWIDEKLKIWKGEPYERAMASFYLGIVYYMRRDYNNARAAFENSLFKLRDYAGDKPSKDDYAEQESSFTLALVMLGRTYQRLGREDLAEANFARARQLLPAIGPLGDSQTHAGSNVLLVVDFGYGPRKVTDFDGSIVGFSPTPEQVGRLPRPMVMIDGQPWDDSATVATVDTVQMAADRRWQSIDTIRTVKSGLGTALIAGGAGYGIYRGSQDDFRGEDAAIVGGLILAGALLKATSQADVRQWEMLPRTTYVLPLRLPPGTHDVTVVFPDAAGLRQTWQNVRAPAQGDATYYMRMNRWLSGPFVFRDPAMPPAQRAADQPSIAPSPARDPLADEAAATLPR